MKLYRRDYLKIKEHWIAPPYMEESRRIRVLLPIDYQSGDKDYPVVYMHDGQNIFYNRESFSGYSWRVIQTIKRNPDLAQMIVVAIDNSGIERINEYTSWKISSSPYPYENTLGGYGDLYGDFLMEVVKPFIDQTYRTRTEKKYTAMCGSSLGGNITSYLGVKYSQEIGNLGVFSSANWITRDEFKNFIRESKLDPDQKVYIQVGTQEGDEVDRKLIHGNMKQVYIDESLDYYKELIKGGIEIDNIKLDLVADAKHNERAWADSLLSCLEFFSKDWQ